MKFEYIGMIISTFGLVMAAVGITMPETYIVPLGAILGIQGLILFRIETRDDPT